MYKSNVAFQKKENDGSFIKIDQFLTKCCTFCFFRIRAALIQRNVKRSGVTCSWHCYSVNAWWYVDNTMHVNEFLHALNIGTPYDFKASTGVRNDPRTHVGVKIDPRNPFTWLFLGTLSKVNSVHLIVGAGRPFVRLFTLARMKMKKKYLCGH